MSEATSCKTYLGDIYTPLHAGHWVHQPNGALVVDGAGKIVAVRDRSALPAEYVDSETIDVTPALLIPGLIDCHQHLSHYEWIRSVPDLFEWLKRIYAIEARFRETDHARSIARSFFRELLHNGTTTCCVHGPYFRDATEIAFEEAEASEMRVLMGMNMGDTDLPAELSMSAEQSLRQADGLHAAWSERNSGLIDYVYTVRPAYCSSEKLLRGVGERVHSAGVRIQSHLGESQKGWERIARSLPGGDNEAAVYDGCGLLTTQTVMAHGIYTSDEERELLAERGVSIAHCPRANLLAGGAQMDLRKYRAAGIEVGLGTDLGAGKGLSLFRTMEDALKVTPDLSIHELFRLATLGGAGALGLERGTGSLEVGKDADFLVVSPKCAGREQKPELEDTLSSLVFRGDDRNIQQIFVRGKSLTTG